MTAGPDLAALATALRATPGFEDLDQDSLEPMPVKGIAHDHVRLGGRGLVARIPRISQFALAPEQNLAYQAACFQRAQRSGRTPGLAAVLAPTPGLRMGALVVEEIPGAPPRLPDDLPALARCLAAIHALPLPAPEARPPLADHADPLPATLAVIERQSGYFVKAVEDPAARAMLAHEIEWARAFAGQTRALPPITLVGTDTHPGNFLVEPGGRAVFVDLEKALYGTPGIDLAHATLETSVRWDPDGHAPLAPAATRAFYRAWQDAAPPVLAAALRPWVAPLRRLTWLRTLSFYARWWVETRNSGADGWAAANVDPAVTAHFTAVVQDGFRRSTIERVRSEWADGFPSDLLP